MFNKRKTFSGSRGFSREFFETFLADLERARFDHVEVMLPHNLVGIDEHLITGQEFLDRERNYPAVIVRAKDSQKQETLKVLFVNKDSKASFFDDTFPSGESQRPGLYFQSPDPGRTYAVFQFFYEYLTRSETAGISSLVFAVSGLFVIFEVISLVFEKQSFIAAMWDQSVVWDVIGSIVAVVVLFLYFAQSRGLWIKPRRELGFLQLANRAFRGDLRDNPLVLLVVAILGTVIGGLLLKLFNAL